METSDGLLVNQTLKGKSEAYTELVNRHREGAVRAAYHLVRDSDAAQDLAQDAFVDAYRSLRSLKEPDRFRAWLFGILHHKCSKHIARSARGPVFLDSVEPSPSTFSHDPLTETTLCALNSLPDDCRSLLAARYLQDLSYEDIAFALKTTVNNVRVRCSRAKAQLRRLVQETDVAYSEKKGGLQ